MKTVVGLYDDLPDARRVVNDLIDAGVPEGNINLIAGDPEGRYATQLAGREAEDDEAEAAADGAVAGGILGGLGGLLLGLGAFAIPGLGPVVAAGPLAAGLIGAGIGAASGGLIGALVEWGVSEEEAEFYLEGVRRGGMLVAVKTSDEQADEVAEMMDQAGLIDLEERVGSWRREGWTGYDADEYEDIDFDRADELYRAHYDEHYADTGEPYEWYTPAYGFGYFLGTRERLGAEQWEELEPTARRMWEEQYDEDWDRYKGAVEYSWQQATDLAL